MIRRWSLLLAAGMVVVLVAVGSPDAAGGPKRTWTDATGQLEVEAEYLTVEAGKVWLLRYDGRVFGVRPESLSQADRDYVDEQVRRKAAQPPRHTEKMPGRPAYGPGRRLCELASKAVDESSGLACSRRKPGCFWTHNDSGDNAILYLFDSQGRDLGSCTLADVVAFDWEDIASFQRHGKPYLLVGDVGNNGRAADIQILYLVEEPPLDSAHRVQVDQVAVAQEIFYSYEDDHRDCEALAVDPSSDTIVLVTKERADACYVYQLPWPRPQPRSQPAKALSAKRIATLKIPPVTAMDISPDGRRAVVLTYASAYEFARRDHEDWAAAFARKPREIIVPERIQGESICFGLDGETLYLTSENRPTPLIEIPVQR